MPMRSCLTLPGICEIAVTLGVQPRQPSSLSELLELLFRTIYTRPLRSTHGTPRRAVGATRFRRTVPLGLRNGASGAASCWE